MSKRSSRSAAFIGRTQRHNAPRDLLHIDRWLDNLQRALDYADDLYRQLSKLSIMLLTTDDEKRIEEIESWKREKHRKIGEINQRSKADFTKCARVIADIGLDNSSPRLARYVELKRRYAGSRVRRRTLIRGQENPGHVPANRRQHDRGWGPGGAEDKPTWFGTMLREALEREAAVSKASKNRPAAPGDQPS